MRRQQKESRRIQGVRDKEKVGTNLGHRQDQSKVWSCGVWKEELPVCREQSQHKNLGTEGLQGGREVI